MCPDFGILCNKVWNIKLLFWCSSFYKSTTKKMKKNKRLILRVVFTKKGWLPWDLHCKQQSLRIMNKVKFDETGHSYLCLFRRLRLRPYLRTTVSSYLCKWRGALIWPYFLRNNIKKAWKTEHNVKKGTI